MSEISGRIGDSNRDQPAEHRSALSGPDRARQVRACSAGHVAIVLVALGEEFRGASVTAHCVTSIDPPLLLISLEVDSHIANWIEEAGLFSFNLLEWKHQLLADRFAGLAPLAPRRLQGIPHQLTRTGPPILTDSLCWAACEVRSTLETGDHICVVGDMVETGGGAASGDPLLHFERRYRRLT